MEVWTVVYNRNGSTCIFEVEKDDLKENTFDEVVRVFKEVKHKDIESGTITSFNVTYTRHYDTVYI